MDSLNALVNYCIFGWLAGLTIAVISVVLTLHKIAEAVDIHERSLMADADGFAERLERIGDNDQR